MVTMRTEHANCAGGAAAVASQPIVLANKSQQDVEAAFAIAQLSEQKPREMDCHARTTSYIADSQLANGCSSATPSPPRISHMRTAVMPPTCSRVQRAALKRKFVVRDAERVAAVNSYSKQARLQDAVDPVQRAIKSERDTFMTARRHHSEHELIGRFVRTCGPDCGDDVQHQHRLYVGVSDHTVSPTLVSSVPSLFTSGGSGERGMTRTDDRPPVLSPHVGERSYLPQSTLQPRRRAPCRDNSDALWEARGTSTPKRPVLPQHHGIPVPPTRRIVPLSYVDNIDKLQGWGTFKCSAYDDGSQRRDRLPSSLISAYYSLGQTAASQLFANPPHSNSAESNRLVPSTGVCQSRQPRVDSCTLRKVRRGEFGALSTLRLYCNQLRRHSEPAGRSTEAVKQSASDDDEIAVDLSMRKHSAEEPGSDVVSAAWYRTSRSCGSSPSVRQDEVSGHWRTAGELVERVQRQMTSVSLPCSPYTSLCDNDHHSSLLHQRRHTSYDTVTATATRPAAAVDDFDVERTSSDMTEAIDVIPDSRLPLKKRRLHYPQQSALAVISEDNCDKPWMNETTHEASSVSSPLASAAAMASVDCEVKERDVERVQCSRSVVLRPDEDGDLPLHIAVAKGTAAAVDSIISLMLSLGVSLDYCNNRHQTALHLAVLTDQADIVRRLLDCGASSDVADARGQTCAHTAVLLDTTSCLRQLLRHSRHPLHINALSYDGVTALHLAVQRGNVDAVRCLVSAGADVDVLDTKYGRTALYYAMERNDVTAAELLLSFGANSALVTTPTVQTVYSSKCSTDLLQILHPALNHRQLPACCPTG